MNWSELADWWLEEVNDDPAYATVVTPLLLEVLKPVRGRLYLDLGCGEGRVMRAVTNTGAAAQGIDLAFGLARQAMVAVVARLPEIPMRDEAFDGTYAVLTIEHIENHTRLFDEAARVTRPGGIFALVINHPVWTAPGSTPIVDDDGESLWRSGEYFTDRTSEVTAGGENVVFYHRPVSHLLNAAAASGWALEHMIEKPHHSIENQSGIPRLLACRWRLGSRSR